MPESLPAPGAGANSDSYKYYAALVLAGLLLYGHCLGFGFNSLDDNVIQTSQDFLRDPANLLEVFRRDVVFSLDGSALYYRPVANLVLMLQARLGGADPFVYRFTNLFLHLLAACLVFRLLTRLRHSEKKSFYFSLIFLAHPAVVQVVCWIAGGNGSLLTVFVLAAFLSALGFWDTGRLRYAAAHALFFALAMFTKESAVGLVPACFLYRYFIGKKKIYAAGWPLAAGWALGAGAWLLLRSLALKQGLPLTAAGVLKSVFGNLPAVISGFGDLALPVNIHIMTAARDINIYPGLAAAAGLGLLLLLSKRARPGYAAFGLCWFLLFLLPGLLSPLSAAANFMPHRVYLPFFGLIVALMEIDLVKFAAGKKAEYLGAAVLAFLCAGGLAQSRNYRDALSFWARAAADSPGSDMAHVGFGTALSGAGRLEEAELQFRWAITLDPADIGAYHNLGLALAGQGRLQEALAQYRAALNIKPGFAEAHLYSGVALAALGRSGEALQHYAEALRLAPHYADAHYYLAFTLAAGGNPEGAAEHYRAALLLRPSYAEAHHNLGVILAGQGRAGEAVEHYRRALALKPGFAEAHYNLGVTLGAMGRAAEAEEQYRRALALKPGLAAAHVNLGVTLAARGGFEEAIVHYGEALRLQPDFVEAYNNWGIALTSLGRLDEALARFRGALRIAPGYRDAAKNLEIVSGMKKAKDKP
ncbi:MAG TPA: tetratricopeptide repeat protein [Elusimicrobiales bacterium]|nr:tetratricopeptide repeat protein [Elusimicrobiales bacterium]